MFNNASGSITDHIVFLAKKFVAFAKQETISASTSELFHLPLLPIIHFLLQMLALLRLHYLPKWKLAIA
jgi:hypothetical protein